MMPFVCSCRNISDLASEITSSMFEFERYLLVKGVNHVIVPRGEHHRHIRGSSLHSGIEFGRIRTGEWSSGGEEEGGGVRSGPGAARTILRFHTISARPPKQPLLFVLAETKIRSQAPYIPSKQQLVYISASRPLRCSIAYQHVVCVCGVCVDTFACVAVVACAHWAAKW
jgi:hypothetical protein